MNAKKSYFILSPDAVDDTIKKKAMAYYGEKDYKLVTDNEEFITSVKAVINCNHGRTCNTDLLLIGASSMSMALSNSIYVAKNWEDSDYCKVCHALAFSHGLEIVYES